MTRQEAQELLDRYQAGTCSPAERTLIEQWYLLEGSARQLPDADFLAAKSEIWERVSELNGIEYSKDKRKKRLYRFSAAAGIALLLSIGLFFMQRGLKPTALTQSTKPDIQVYDIDPGGNRAILTLADGSRIVLDDKKEGLIATQEGLKISKSADGLITYELTAATADHAGGYNTIETPRGGKYQVILPDGSSVWLNAASSLRFPAAFSNTGRDVELTGEGYFEVAKNKDLPFRVHTRDMNIVVTGTHFNVKAYEDETYSAATLVEGSVDVFNPGQKLHLRPGDQARTGQGRKLSMTQVDTDEAIAWKNGLFQFNNSDIHSVMREISRWYDVSVEYRGKVPNNHFGGYISRDSKLSQVLKMLELSGVRFAVKENKIIVLP